MKILICAPVIPIPATSGLKIRVFNLARELAREHQVHLFCLSETRPEPEQERVISDAGMGLTVVHKPLNGMVDKLSVYARRMAGRVPPEFILSWEDEIFTALERLGDEGDFDVALAEHLFMARYLAAVRCPRVLVLHNIESDLAAALARTYRQPLRSYKRLAAWWALGYEKRMLGIMQGAVTVSDGDLARLRELKPGLPAVTVENGVDCAAYEGVASAPRPDGRRLLYLGLMSYESNVDAVKWFTGEVLPLIKADYPDTVFTIAGGDPVGDVVRLGHEDGVDVTGFVDDVKPLYRENDLLVVPLRLGGGSRLKILEAFAAGTPVVSTSKGAEGLRVSDGEHLLIADSPAAMAAAVSRLYSDPATVTAIREAALRLVAERYDWSILAGRLASYLSEVAGRG